MASILGATLTEVARLAVGASVTRKLMVPSSNSGTNSVPNCGTSAIAATIKNTAKVTMVFFQLSALVKLHRYSAVIGFNTRLSLTLIPRLNNILANAGTITMATIKAESMANIKKKVGKYSGGLKIGMWKEYSDKGELIETIHYKGGEIFKINGFRVKEVKEEV